jgi:Cdc6-like AAA superfamily ATPase
MEFKIFVNPEILSQSHVPERLRYREKEFKQLKTCLVNSVSVFVHGPHGSGKTVLLKKALGELTRIRAIHIDCSLYQTTNAILREILSGSPVFSRSNYDLLKRVCDRTKGTKVVVGFDHVERLKEKEIISKFVALGFTVVVVARSEEFVHSIDPRARSSIPISVTLEGYSIDQVFDLLKQRVQLALAEGSYTDESIRKIAESTRGNLTSAISVLRAAAFRAESEGKRSIDEVPLKEILVQHNCPEGLTHDERVIMKILYRRKSLPARELFALYREQASYPKGERSFRKYMQALCVRGLVRALGNGRWRVYEVVKGDQGSD